MILPEDIAKTRRLCKFQSGIPPIYKNVYNKSIYTVFMVFKKI